MAPIQIFLLVIVIVLGVGMMYVMITGKERTRRSRSLSVISGQAKSGGVGGLKNDRDKKRADLAKKLKGADSLEKKEKKGTIKDLLMQAGMPHTSPVKFWILAFIFGTITTLLSKYIWGFSGLGLVLVATTLYLGVPRAILKRMVKKRQKIFLKEFPDVLESMMRLLKAGMPIGEAIAMVAREFEGPIAEEMQRVYDEQKVGIPLSEAVMGVAERVPLTEVQMFATGIAIQQQTGSSLSEILQNLASVIRARFRLRRKVDALSSEAKASASIIASLPVLVALGLYFANRPYIMLLFTDGQHLIIGCLVWMSFGVLIMKQMINFKV
ncbi:MAG: type II secretion system F family protein [Alphaproteobacteria bacterium]|nr:type II secretion system F family protein [Alphaproteobacteria bacterium]